MSCVVARPLIPALRWQRQVDLCQLNTNKYLEKKPKQLNHIAQEIQSTRKCHHPNLRVLYRKDQNPKMLQPIVVPQDFNPSTSEEDAEGSLILKPAWSTE